MVLGGLMKTTLLDFPGLVACTVFTKGCNIRCPFCHNASLVLPDRYCAEEISEADFFSFLNRRSAILDGVVVSGGEPTIQPDIIEFLYKVRSLGFKIKLDTNGTFPKKLKEIISSGTVDYIAMDIKNSRQKYDQTSGSSVLSNVTESIKIIMSSDIDYEFRTTAVNELHTVDDFLDIGEMISGTKRYYIQSYVDSGDILGTIPFSPPSDELLNSFLMAAREKIPTAELRGV